MARKARIKLTDKIVRELKGPTDGKAGYKIYYDAVVIGFGNRVTIANAKSWILNYRAKGREPR